jgi:uncharacterized protein
MDDFVLKSLLESVRTIEIVGLSTDPEKPSRKVAQTLVASGYDVIPVHPTASEIMGRKAYASLRDIPVPVDIVDVFRPAEEAVAVARAAVSIGARILWLQLGITSEAARTITEEARLQYLEDVCVGETTVCLGNRAATPFPPGEGVKPAA